MNTVMLFGSWLDDIPMVSAYLRRAGHWFDFEKSTLKRYIAIQVVGGIAPREINTRMPQFSVTLVGAKDESHESIGLLAEAIMSYAQELPPQCEIVAVNAFGEPLGPIRTEGGRPVITMSFQMII
jgi:hypothetical protein